MARSIFEILGGADLSGMVMVTGETTWIGMWLPLPGCREMARQERCSNGGDALVRAAVANRG